MFIKELCIQYLSIDHIFFYSTNSLLFLYNARKFTLNQKSNHKLIYTYDFCKNDFFCVHPSQNLIKSFKIFFCFHLVYGDDYAVIGLDSTIHNVWQFLFYSLYYSI